MLKAELLSTLNLYMGHMVRVLFIDGTYMEGECVGYTENSISVFIDGIEKELSFADIEDIRYKGVVSEYHTNRDCGEIDSSFQFCLEDCQNTEEQKKRLCYHEFTYGATCHLVREKEKSEERTGIIRDDMGRIRAKDVLLEESVYILNVPVLEQGYYLYTLKNGERIVGKLSAEQMGYAIFYDEKRICTLLQKEIAEISKLPQINDCVIVEVQNRQIKGLVSAVKYDGFYVCTYGEAAEWVRFCDLTQIRYQGEIKEEENPYGKLYFVDGKYWTKQQYLQSWIPGSENVEPLSNNTVVSYGVVVNMRGLVAKELCVEQKVEHAWRKGIVLTMNPQGIGYIGTHYVPGSNIRGNVSFSREKHWPKSEVLDLMKFVYVVEYSIDGRKKDKKVGQVISMEVVKTYKRAKIGEVSVDESGNVHVIPFFYKNITQYMNREVRVLMKEEDEQVQGVLDSVNENDGVLTVSSGTGERETIAIDKIDDIRIVGYVTTYYAKNGTGYIDNKNYFNIKNVKDAMKYSGLEGKCVSFLLQGSSKGDGTDAVDVVVEERTQIRDVWIVSFGESSCKVIEKAVYGGGELSAQMYYDALEEVEVQINDYKKSDLEKDENYSDRLYSAKMKVCEDQAGNEIKSLVAIEYEEFTERKFYKGRIGFFNKTYGYVIDWKNRDISNAERAKNSLDISFKTSNVYKLNEEKVEALDIKLFTYDVLYTKGLIEGRKVIAEKVYVTEKTEKDYKGVSDGIVINRPRAIKRVPEIAIGETYGYKSEREEKTQYTTVKEIEKEYVVGEDGVKVEKTKITRFGIFTGLDCSSSDEQEHEGYLNDEFAFALDRLEQKTKNEILTDPMMMLLSYTCDENGITYVSRVKNLETISWEKASISNYITDSENLKKREIVLNDGDIKCYSHTSTNGAINAVLKSVEKAWYEKSVYVKMVKLAKKGKLESFAGEIRLEEERAFIDIKDVSPDNKDSGKYIAKREGTTEEFYIDDAVAKDWCHQVVNVKFVPNEQDRTADLIPVIANVLQNKKDNFVLEDAALLHNSEVISGKKTSEIVKLLEEKMENILETNIEDGEDEYNYIACTLQRAHKEDKRYLFDLFCTLMETNSKEADGQSEQDKFVSLFENIEWNEEKLTKFIQKTVMVDDASYEWMKESAESWMTDSMATAICNKCEKLSYAIKWRDNQTKKKDVVKMLGTIRYKLSQAKTTWIEAWEDFNEANVVRQLVELKGKIDNQEGDAALEWYYLGTKDREHLMQFLQFAKRIDTNELTVSEFDEVEMELNEWKKAQNNRTRLVTEILLCVEDENEISVPELLSRAIETRSDQLFGSLREPKLSLDLIDECIFEGQTELRFCITNGTRNTHERRRYRAAQDVVVKVRLCKEQSEGKKTVAETPCNITKLEQYTDDGLECYMGSIKLPTNMKEYGKSFFVEVECGSTVLEGGKDGIVTIEGIEVKVRQDYSSVENPYPTNSDALEALSEAFFGRVKQKKEIQECLLRKGTVPRIFVHGQRRCGKSSVVSQFINEDNNMMYKYAFKMNAQGEIQELSEEPNVLDNVIIFKFDVPSVNRIIDREEKNAEVINDFYHEFEETLFESFLSNLWAAVTKRPELKEFGNYLTKKLYGDESEEVNSYKAMFNTCMAEFSKCKDYRIVCVIDEFTDYCALIPQACNTAFNFMGDFSRFNIAQIYVGHEVMKREIDRLGVTNKTFGRSLEVPLQEFEPNEARNMVIEPFKKCLGHNPFEHICGERTIRKILDLSARNPYILNKMCHELFDYFVQQKVSCLTADNVTQALETSVLNKENGPDKYYWFDAFFCAKGDAAEVRTETIKYLAALAKDETLSEVDKVKENPWEEWDETRRKKKEKELKKRRVIVDTGEDDSDTVRIFVELLRDYLLKVSVNTIIEKYDEED